MARGTIVNTVFLLAMNALAIVQGVLAAALLGAAEYGLWGLIVISFGTLFALAAVGFDDKYIHQDDVDQQAAFEIAFTLQAILCGLFTLIALVAIPLFSLIYDEPRILVPGLLLAAVLPLIALQAPVWVFYRRMDFVKQRVLESSNPVVAFVVTVALALAGLGSTRALKPAPAAREQRNYRGASRPSGDHRPNRNPAHRGDGARPSGRPGGNRGRSNNRRRAQG